MIAIAEILTQVCRVIADITGNDLDEVVADALFEDDLGMSEIELERVIHKINKTLNINLHLASVLSEGIETVGELTQMVVEESELG